MIDVGIGMLLPFMWVIIEMTDHIFVYFHLQIYSYCAIASDNFIGAHSGVKRHVTAWIRDADIIRHIFHLMMCSFDSRGGKSLNKTLM